MVLQKSSIDIKQEQYRILVDEVNKCEMCPDLVYSRKLYPCGRPVIGSGNIDADIMFVGEAPGRYGAGTTCIPFTKDRSGKFFNRLLEVLDLTRSDVYVTNVVKCCPENNRTPNKTEIANCFNFLVKEINIVNPKIIVIMGKTAFGAFKTHYDDFKNIKSAPYFSYSIALKLHGERMYYVTYHPAYYLRSGKIPLAIKHFKYLREIYESLR